MPERSPFLQRIAELLNSGLGARHQKVPVWEAAVEMDAAPPSPAADAIRSMFTTWCERCGYLEPEHPGTYLPATIWESTPEGALRVDGKRVSEDERMRWRAERIERCSLALREGWDEGAARSFIVSFEEWNEAKDRAKRAVA